MVAGVDCVVMIIVIVVVYVQLNAVPSCLNVNECQPDENRPGSDTSHMIGCAARRGVTLTMD